MFANPVMKTILKSSGAIPVRRNPNTASPTSGESSTHKENLFRETSNALAAGKVVGVFPEGTSYTGSSILQVMPGAAWAAVEYARSLQQKDKNIESGLHIVPVGIVYTDKSQYKSRVRSFVFSVIAMLNWFRFALGILFQFNCRARVHPCADMGSLYS